MSTLSADDDTMIGEIGSEVIAGVCKMSSKSREEQTPAYIDSVSSFLREISVGVLEPGGRGSEGISRVCLMSRKSREEQTPAHIDSVSSFPSEISFGVLESGRRGSEGISGVCMMSRKWRDEQAPSYIDSVSSFLSENSFDLEFVSIDPDLIFNCEGLSVAFVFVTNWDCGNPELVFNRVQKLEARFKNLYVVVCLPTKEKKDSFQRSYFKFEREIGGPVTFVPIQGLEMGFEKMIKIALSGGACKQEDVTSGMKAEVRGSSQMENFIEEGSSIVAFGSHEETMFDVPTDPEQHLVSPSAMDPMVGSYSQPKFPQHFQWAYMTMGMLNTPENRQVLSPVRNQLASDHCTYISVISTIEARMRLAWNYNGHIREIGPFSVYNLADAEGHQRGRGEKILRNLEIAKTNGLVLEKDYDPWRWQNGFILPGNEHHVYQYWRQLEETTLSPCIRHCISSYDYVPLESATEQQIMNEIMLNGPVIGVEEIPLIHLEPGLNCRGGPYNGHALSIVGFSRDHNNELSWIVQESMGPDCYANGYKTVRREHMMGVFIPVIF